jgi:hypothetical protein
VEPSVIELLFAVLLSQHLEPATPFADFLMKDSEIARAAALTKQHYIAIERREFADRFDSLILALRAFEVEYCKYDGIVWPKRQAEEVDKAIRRLESTAAWKQYHQPKRTRDVAQK